MARKKPRIQTSTQIENDTNALLEHAQYNAESQTHEKAYLGFVDYFNGFAGVGGIQKIEHEQHWLYVKIIDSVRMHFHSLHKIKGMDRYILKRFTDLKFDNGSVAMINFENEVIPVSYKLIEKDVVGRPYKIEVIHPDIEKLNGKKYTKDNFVIIHNNSESSGTLALMLEQIKQITGAKNDIDNNQLLTRPILGVKGKASSKSWKDVKAFFESGESVMPIDNIDLSDISFELTEFEDRHESKKSNFLFQMKVFSMFLGINITDLMSSANEKTELEISEGMLFAGKLLENMEKELQDGLEECNEVLGTTFTAEPFIDMDNEEEDLKTNHLDEDISEKAKGEE